MTHVALTCPRLGFTLGLSVSERPGRRDAIPELVRALEDLGGPVTRGAGVAWFSVELADSVDAMIALQALRRTLDTFDIDVQSIIGSTAAIDLLSDPVVESAWQPVRDELVTDQQRHADLTRGVAAARHYTPLVAWPTPDAIAMQQLPSAPGLVLWTVRDGKVIVIDHEPFTIGRDPMCDLAIENGVIGRRHLSFTRSNEGWHVRDLGSPSGYSIDGFRQRSPAELRPGMVIQLARPHAFVVLAINPK